MSDTPDAESHSTGQSIDDQMDEDRNRTTTFDSTFGSHVPFSELGSETSVDEDRDDVSERMQDMQTPSVPWYRSRSRSGASSSNGSKYQPSAGSAASSSGEHYNTGVRIFKELLRSTDASTGQIQKNIQEKYLQREVA